MQKPVDEQIAEVKNNIRYFCNKYKWENYESSHHHKHHHRHSKHSNKMKEKVQVCEKKHKPANLKGKREKVTKNEIISIKSVNLNDNIDNQKQQKVQQKEEFDLNNAKSIKTENQNDQIKDIEENNILIDQKNEKESDHQNIINHPDAITNNDTKNQICLLSSDEDSDSSFDFNEFQKFFKAQDDLYHLTKHSKHEKSKKKKQKAIILYSDSDFDSASLSSDSSFDSDGYSFTNNIDFQNHKNTVNNYLTPAQTKDQSTNTVKKEYSSTDTQTNCMNNRTRSSNKKIKFSAQLKANVKRSFNSLMHSSSSSGSKSYSNSSSSNYSNSRGSSGNSIQKLNSIKASSEQYASSENESSKDSSKIHQNASNNNNLSSSNSSKKSLQESKKIDDLDTNKLTRIENALVLIEEEEEEVSDAKENIKNTINNTEETKIADENLKESQKLTKGDQTVIQNKINDNNATGDLNQDVDIEKLIEEVSQNSSRIKQTVKKSKKNKKNQSSLKIGSAETDENTEAYSQIPSEFSDNIGVDSSLGYKQNQLQDETKNEKIAHAKTAVDILRLEDFIQQSDNIHISSKLENEYEEPKKNYNNYASSSGSAIDIPS